MSVNELLKKKYCGGELVFNASELSADGKLYVWPDLLYVSAAEYVLCWCADCTPETGDGSGFIVEAGPSPATHTILILTEAGEQCFRSFFDKNSVPCT